MYEAILTIHILSGIAWVGGGFVLILGVRNIKAAEGQAAADHTIGALENTTKWLFGIAPPLVFITGIAQVLMSEQHDWSDLWIMWAVALAVVSAILGAGVAGRWEKQMKGAREAGRSLPDVFDRWMRLNWYEWAILLVIVALMVFKPV